MFPERLGQRESGRPAEQRAAGSWVPLRSSDHDSPAYQPPRLVGAKLSPRGKARVVSERHEVEFSGLRGRFGSQSALEGHRSSSRAGAVRVQRSSPKPAFAPATPAKPVTSPPPNKTSCISPHPEAHINPRRPAVLTSAFALPFFAPLGNISSNYARVARLWRSVSRRSQRCPSCCARRRTRSWAGHGRPTQHPASHRQRHQCPQHVEQQQHRYRNSSCHRATGFKRRHHGQTPAYPSSTDHAGPSETSPTCASGYHARLPCLFELSE